MYDDDGNAVPIPAGRFYYDHVDSQPDEEEDRKSNQPGDTVRANKPAALAVTQSLAASESGEAACAQDDDTTESSYEDETEEEYEENDQFMRISAAPSKLQDPSRVKKDLDHDKPHKKTSRSTTGGLSAFSRGASSSNADRKHHGSNSASGSSTTHADSGHGKDRASGTTRAPGHDRHGSSKSGSKPGGARPGVAAVGRVFSLTKEKRNSTSAVSGSGASSTRSSAPTDAASSEHTGDRQRSNQGSPSTHKTAKRSSLAAVGRLLSLSGRDSQQQATPSKHTDASEDGPKSSNDADTHDGSDRPRATPNAAPTRAGLAQIGRIMSMPKRKTTESPGDAAGADDGEDGQNQFTFGERERRETEGNALSPGPRMGIKQAGRMMSMSKKAPGMVSSEASPRARDAANASTFGNAANSAKAGDRDRTGDMTPANIRKEQSRKGLRAAGRLLSFSRKADAPAAPASTGAAAQKPAGAKTPTADPTSRGLVISSPKSPKLDGRANKFFFSEINSASIKASPLLNNEAHIRVPVLAMAEYSGPVSKTKWYIDAFTLPHNAVRRVCIDVYDILMALARCGGDADITRDDMKEFHTWWVVADGFLKCYFEMERKVLFPWVDGAGSKDWEFQMALRKMRGMKDTLHEQLEDINATWQDMETTSPGEQFAKVYRAVDIFCPRMMNYFADQELLLPAIVKSYYRLEDRLMMDKDMLLAFLGEPLNRKNKDAAHHNVVLLVRWIANPRQLRAWVAKNLNSTGRASYNKWHSLYEAELGHILKGFRNRSRVNALAAMGRS